jgi:subtilisin-like proprotein convertase family protein
MKKILSLLVLMLGAQLLQAAIMENYSFTPNVAIPDGPSYGVADIHTISSSILNISSVEVTLNISGEYNGDLYGYLQHDSGFVVLLNRVGKTASNPYGYADTGFAVTLSTSGANDVHNYQNFFPSYNGSGQLTGTWQPDGRNADPSVVLDTSPRNTSFSSFNTLDANGDWTLFLADVYYGGTNWLNSWSLSLSGEITPVPEPVNIALAVFAVLAVGHRVVGGTRLLPRFRQWVRMGRN